MSVSTRDGRWVVPPQQAVWVPARVEHEIHCLGPLEMRSLYLHPDSSRSLPSRCLVLQVPPFLRELVLLLSRAPVQQTLGSPQGRLAAVLLDQLQEMKEAPLHLPLGQDPRLRAVVDRLVAHPSDNRDLEDFGQYAGASGRTLARLFVAETGLTFGRWRRQLKLIESIARLGEGKTITQVAFELGYRSPSAFTAMFRNALGTCPSTYMGHRRKGNDVRGHL